MTLRYTTREAIALRLEKRLQVGGAQSTIGRPTVDDNLITVVAAQVEARVTQAINTLYRTPLLLINDDTRQVVASVVEKLILAEILPVHIVQDTGREGGLRLIMATEGARELQLISSGAVVLVGEVIEQTSDRIVPETTSVGQRGTQTIYSAQGTTRIPPKSQGRAENIQW